MSTKWRFSTAGIPATDRLKAWQENIHERLSHYRVDVNARRQEDLYFDAKGIITGSIRSSLYRMREQEMFRLSNSTNAVEEFGFVFPLAGNFESIQRDRSISAQTGHVYALHPAESYKTIASNHASSIYLSAAFLRIKERVDWVEDCFGRENFVSPEIVPLLRSFATSLVDLNVSDDISQGLEDCCLDLLTLMLEGGRRSLGGDLIPWSMKNTVRTNLELFIKQNFANPNLSAADAAMKFGVSERYIHKLMSEHGTTFLQAIYDCRLDEARRLLASPVRHLRIGQVALRCGFINQAHFATRYRKRYGHSPKDERAAAK